jgi:hypothetical protein
MNKLRLSAAGAVVLLGLGLLGAKEEKDPSIREIMTRAHKLPTKGEQKSWVGWTNRYLVGARVLDSAVEKRDKKSALAAAGQLRLLCAGCHEVHRK